MSDEPAREQPRLSQSAPARRSPLVFVSAVFGCAFVAEAIADVSVGAHWPYPAVAAAGAVASALVLRRALTRSRTAACRRVYYLSGEPAFVCQLAARHRGDHREGNVAWGRKGGLYEWRGRATR